MRNEGKIRQIRYFSAVPLLVFGILMLAVPSFSTETVSTVLGGIFSALGLVELFLFLTEAKIRYRLLLGVLCTVLGTVFISVHTVAVVFLVQLAVGFLVIADGMYKIRLSAELYTRGARLWFIPLALSIAIVVLGVIVIFWPAEGAFLPSLFGITILVDSVGELLIGFYNGNFKGKPAKRPANNRSNKR